MNITDASTYLHGRPRESTNDLQTNQYYPGVSVVLGDGATVLHLTANSGRGAEGMRWTSSYEVGSAGELRIWERKVDYSLPTDEPDRVEESVVITYGATWWRSVNGIDRMEGAARSDGTTDEPTA